MQGCRPACDAGALEFIKTVQKLFKRVGSHAAFTKARDLGQAFNFYAKSVAKSTTIQPDCASKVAGGLVFRLDTGP